MGGGEVGFRVRCIGEKSGRRGWRRHPRAKPFPRKNSKYL